MKKSRKLLSFGLIALLAIDVNAAGYKLEFQSSSILADAGEAAVVEDAGTNWYNSAGLVYLPMQFVSSLIDVYAPTTFRGSVNAPSTLNTLGPPFNLLASNFTANGSASSHPNSFLPAMHLSLPMTKECISLGFSFIPAWGFTEDYSRSSILRYNLTRVYTKTMLTSASLAFKINSQWSMGIGPDIHYFSVESRTNVRTQTILNPSAPDSISRFSADNWGYGGHVGILYNYDDNTRIGLNYRSKLMMHLKGYSQFTLNEDAFFETNLFRLPLPLPATTTLSLYHDINPCWALMGTIAYDQWSSIQNYHARGYIEPPTPLTPSPTIRNDIFQPQHMRNTVDASIGTHYKLNQQIMLRASFKYEGTPAVNSYRYVSFPDGPKYGVQIGARYQATPSIALDMIYGHVWIPSVHINDVNPATFATAVGHNNTSVDLLGGQIVWNI